MFSSYHQEFLKKKIKLILNIFGNGYFTNKKILDIGAGNGDLSAVLFRLGNSVTSLDARKEHLEIIHRKYPGIKIFRQDLDFQPKLTDKYGVIFHLGTLCHIGKWERNLRSCCENSTDLILETAVADINSEFEFEMIEDCRIFDKSYSGKSSRVSAQKIERVISESGMFLCRLDLPELNYQSNVYDWKEVNSGKKDLFLRRFWICSKNRDTIEQICKKCKVKIIEITKTLDSPNNCQLITNEEIVTTENKSLIVESKEITAKIEMLKVSNVEPLKENKLFETNLIENSLVLGLENKEIGNNVNGISVIIPAFNSSKFIDECVDSIKNQKCDFDVEIIIGIDHCQSTLDHIKADPTRYEGINVFWMEKNVGPYVVKNALIDQAKYENVLFFDSDDIMIDGSLKKIYDNIDDSAILTFKYFNFFNEKGLSSAKEHNRFAEGVFFIKKSIFNSLNGFEPWKCAADTEFHERSKYNKIKYKNLNNIVFYRRIHNSSLTVSKETNYGSQLRSKFSKIIVEKRNANNWKLIKKHTENFEKFIFNKIEDENKLDKNISVIIPAWKADLFIEDCIKSINNQSGKYNIEIIIGIDSCKDTLDKINQFKKKYQNVRYFMFNENIGPYLIKNTLIKYSNFEKIIFFDADDLMHQDLIKSVFDKIIEKTIVRFKYYNFNNFNTNFLEKSTFYAHGVFGITKSSFLNLKGFEPWKCSADSEFHKRAHENNFNFFKIDNFLFYRRKHENNLTSRSETNSTSSIRKTYIELIKNKKNWNLEKMSTNENFSEILKNKFLHLVISRVCVKWKYNGKFRHEDLGFNWEDFSKISIDLYNSYCKKSLSSQTNKNFKLISLVDSSVKNSGKHLENELLINVEDVSLISEKIKKYIDLIKGDYEYILITRLDRDDALEENFIENLQKMALNYIDSSKEHYYFDVSSHIMYDARDNKFFTSALYNNVTSPFLSVIEPANNVVCYPYKYSHGDICKILNGKKSENLIGLQIIHDNNVSNRIRGKEIFLNLNKFGL